MLRIGSSISLLFGGCHICHCTDVCGCSVNVGNCRPGGKQWQPTAGFMTHVTCRLTFKNRDQLRNPMLANRVWATFTLLLIAMSCLCK